MRAFILVMAIPLLLSFLSNCAYDEAMNVESGYQRSYINQLDKAAERKQELDLERKRLQLNSLDLLRSQP